MFAGTIAARRIRRARTAEATGDVATARSRLEEALRGARLGEAWASAGRAAAEIGRLDRDAGDLGRAEHHFRLAATQYERAVRSAVTVRGRVDALEALGDVLLARGKPWEAYRAFRSGAQVAGVGALVDSGTDAVRDVVTREEMVWTSHLATAAAGAGRHKLARGHYDHVLEGCERVRDVAGQITCHRGLARLARDRMDWATTADELYAASNLYPELDDPERHTDGWIACLRELGEAYKQLGRRDEQIRAFKLAVRLDQLSASGDD